MTEKRNVFMGESKTRSFKLEGWKAGLFMAAIPLALVAIGIAIGLCF